MNPEDYRLLIPQYLSGQLGPAETELFEAQLTASPELWMEVEELRSLWEGLGQMPQKQPSAALRFRFYQRLNAIDAKNRRAVRNKASWWQLGPLPQLAFGLALFVLGTYVGRVSLNSGVRPEEMAQMRSQVQSLREMVALSLLDRQSATSRLEGVSWGSRVERPDRELMSALVTALNHDPNVNVRLSSLDALEKFTNEASVRKALLDSIPLQDSPLVQIALIDVLVHIRDGAAAVELRRLSQDAEVNASVRQRAQWGLERLGL
ncbi:MAG: HEAT repeat domain-containing protein [Acidobacteriaceae bacterium]|nr:HEAT repeat domain-containing protein [Acidobacteriaceae bacterium]